MYLSMIAIDVVLLPTDNVIKKAIELNKGLRKIKLDKKNCLPHISLMMGCVNEEKIRNFENVLEEIANGFSKIKIKANKIRLIKIPLFEPISVIEIEKTKELQELHEKIVKKLRPYCSYNATKEMIYGADENFSSITLSWINNYLKKSSYENFFPHITLGFGKARKIKPFSFTTSRLALCWLGNYCTCRKILWEKK